MVSQKWGIFTPFHHSGIIKKCLYYIAATEEPRLYEDCITFGLTLPLPYGIWIIGRSIFTRFYPPVGKTLLLWLMDYTHNLKITGNPTLCRTVSYYIGVRTISNAITRSHLARSYTRIGQSTLLPVLSTFLMA